uniref:Uncharacterized protein n=1 Tax=Oryza barthii TaxID=65489 RepID=A0A0D3F8I0_9ORYZ
MDSPSTNKQGPRAPSSQASPARFRFVIGADAVYRSTRLRRYEIRSEPHKMNGRLEMSTGPVASPSAIAARVAADDTRSSACPPRAAERRRRRGWKAVTLAWYVLSSSGLSRASGSASPYVFSEAYIAYRYVLKTFLCLHSQSHLHGCRQRVGIWMRSNHVYCAISVRQECMLDYKVSTNYT